jgi:hypothetical protein
MIVCAGKCNAPSGRSLPIIAHYCPNFGLLQKWAMGPHRRALGMGRFEKFADLWLATDLPS